jgi:hypothetical protein
MSASTQALSQVERSKNKESSDRLLKMPLSKKAATQPAQSVHRPLTRREAVQEAIRRTG